MGIPGHSFQRIDLDRDDAAGLTLDLTSSMSPSSKFSLPHLVQVSTSAGLAQQPLRYDAFMGFLTSPTTSTDSTVRATEAVSESLRATDAGRRPAQVDDEKA